MWILATKPMITKWQFVESQMIGIDKEVVATDGSP